MSLVAGNTVSMFSLGTFGGLGVASLAGGLIAGALGWRTIFLISIEASLLAYWWTRRTPWIRPEPISRRSWCRTATSESHTRMRAITARRARATLRAPAARVGSRNLC